MPLSIAEQDGSGHVMSVYNLSGRDTTRDDKRADSSPTDTNIQLRQSSSRTLDWRSFLRTVFLPAGFPATVSPDYIPSQIYNGMQAFCSSLATLIASRAVLEGHGIGNAEASATHAVLLTVLQDAFSRLTTILGAYYLGTLLYPEAKSYRLVADITNDIAIVLDLLSPQLSSFSLSTYPPFISKTPGTSLRMAALCMSGAFRALCGVAAGGAKAAITLHFAQDGAVPGDVGDLSAKDASKETVLALAGMLCGSMLMPYLHTSKRTYTVVAILLILHVWINYVAVRVVVMKTLNRQRATILWAAYSASQASGAKSPRVLTPAEVASQEYLFGRNSSLLQYESGQQRIIGSATIGAPLAHILSSSSDDHLGTIRRLLEIFADKPFIIGLDTRRPLSTNSSSLPHIVVVLKDGHDQTCHLEAWITANVLASRISAGVTSDSVLACIEDCKRHVDGVYKTYLADIRRAGWDVDSTGILTGASRTIKIQGFDDRKNR